MQTFREALAGLALVDSELSGDQQLADLRDAVAAVQQRIAELPSLTAKGGPQRAGPIDELLVERGPLSGLSNPLAPPLTYRIVDGAETVHASAVFSSAYEGPAGCVHGGYLLAAFDEVLAAGQLPSGGIGMTGTVTVRLRAMTPIDTLIEFAAGTDRVDGRKVFTWATASCRGQLIAEAQATCLRMRSDADAH